MAVGQQTYIDELITRDSLAYSMVTGDELMRDMGFQGNELEEDLFHVDPVLSAVQGRQFYGNIYKSESTKNMSADDKSAAMAARDAGRQQQQPQQQSQPQMQMG